MNQIAIKNARQYINEKYPDISIPKRSYFVLYSPRSGSNFLATCLENAGLGRAVEAFSASLNSLQRMGWGIDFSDPHAFISKAISYQTVNDVLGMKMSPIQLKVFSKNAHQLLDPQFADLTDLELIEVFFPQVKFLHIQRRNKVKQAVSLAKAYQNGIWFEEAGQDEEYKKFLLPPLYDREHIECCFDKVLSFDVFWKQYLRQNNLTALPVVYEDLVAHYDEKMKEIFEFLGVKGHEVPSPKLRRQSNQQSNSWETRFIAETPWLKDTEIARAMEGADLESLYFTRCRMIIVDRESARWRVMPANRYKKFRSFAFKVKRKFSKIFLHKEINPSN